jgi:predicted MFS family arabinose efflux permease
VPDPDSRAARRRERSLVAVLTAVQCTNVLDFVIMMPLGPQLMRGFGVGPREFALVVSSYTFSAAAAGFASAFLMDRFDRKRALLAAYGGFTVATLACALAPGYLALAGARVLAGLFGGVLGALVFAVVADAVPYARRGAATGVVMSSFSVASVLGIPAGMALANAADWHAPFFALALVSALVWGAALALLPPLRGHLARAAVALDGRDERRRQGPVATLRRVFAAGAHRRAFALIAMLMVAGFSVVPFLSPYMVRNVGLTERQLPYIYLAGGLATAVSSTVVGRLADRFGKPRVFTLAAFASAPALVLLTTLPPVSLPVALLVTTLFMVLVNARLVPAFAMITASAEPGERGQFLSVNSAVQQLASGAAAFLGGLVVTEGAGGALRHYELVGAVAVAATLLSVPLARRLRPAAGEARPGDGVRAEGAAPGTPEAEGAPGGTTVPAAVR